MPADIAEHIHHQVGAPIDDLRNVGEVRMGIDEPTKLHDALDARQIIERGGALRDQRDATKARGGLSGGKVEVIAQPPGDKAVRSVRHLTGDEEVRTAAHKRHIIRDSFHRRGQLYAKSGKAGLGQAHRRSLG